jgi:hypothetical protein
MKHINKSKGIELEIDSFNNEFALPFVYQKLNMNSDERLKYNDSETDESFDDIENFERNNIQSFKMQYPLNWEKLSESFSQKVSIITLNNYTFEYQKIKNLFQNGL